MFTLFPAPGSELVTLEDLGHSKERRQQRGGLPLGRLLQGQVHHHLVLRNWETGRYNEASGQKRSIQEQERTHDQVDLVSVEHVSFSLLTAQGSVS